MNLASVDRWSSNLKNKMRRLNWVGASHQLNSGNVRIVHTLVAAVPSFKRFLDQLTDDLRVWRMTGRINPGTMSFEAFEAAEAMGREEYAQHKAKEAEFAAHQAAMYQAYLNTWRRQVEAVAAAAERASQQAAANAQRNRNAAAQRNAQRAKAAANAARRNAKAAENEARFAASEKARLNETARKSTEAAAKAAKAAKAAAAAAKAANNEARQTAAAGPSRQTMRNKQNREFQEQVERVSHWREVFERTKNNRHLTTRQTIRRLAKNHLSLNLNSVLMNTGNVSRKVRFLLHPNKGASSNNRALRQVLSAEL